MDFKKDIGVQTYAQLKRRAENRRWWGRYYQTTSLQVFRLNKLMVMISTKKKNASISASSIIPMTADAYSGMLTGQYIETDNWVG